MGLLAQLLLDIPVRRQVVHALAEEAMRRMDRGRGDDELQLRHGLDVGLFVVGKGLDQPLDHVVGRLPAAGRVEVAHPLAQDRPDQGLCALDVAADLAQVRHEILRHGPRPLGEELELGPGHEDVDGKVDARVHPLLLAVDVGPDEGPAAEPSDGPERKGMPLDRGPVVADGELGGDDVLELLLELGSEPDEVLGQAGAEEQRHQLAIVARRELGVLALQRLEWPCQDGQLLDCAQGCLGAHIGNGLPGAQDVLGQGLELAHVV